MYITVNVQSLNKNIGKFQLPHMWDEVMLHTHALISSNTLSGKPHTWLQHLSARRATQFMLHQQHW